MLVTAHSDTCPAYEKVLATFSQPHLQKLLSKLQAEVKKLEADCALIQRYLGMHIAGNCTSSQVQADPTAAMI